MHAGPLERFAGQVGDPRNVSVPGFYLFGLAYVAASLNCPHVYSSDLERAWAFADRVEVGAVGINVNDVTELQAPFGGWKLSGLGRELGREGLQTYLEQRHIRMRVRPLTDDTRGEQPTPVD